MDFDYSYLNTLVENIVNSDNICNNYYNDDILPYGYKCDRESTHNTVTQVIYSINIYIY